MTFTTLQFFGFLPIVISLYFIIPQRLRWVVLLVSSYFFYLACLGSNFIYSAVLILATIISYFTAILIYKTGSSKGKKTILLCSSVIFIGMLIIFKYLNFLNENINSIFVFLKISLNLPVLKIVIPLGISFFTFQILSYLIDVYNSKTEPIKHFGIYAAGISFFPKLISGPIERSGAFFPQMNIKREIEYNRTAEGVKLFVWGLFKKVVIADRVTYAVNLVFNNPGDYYGVSVLFAGVLLSIQIYADFSGYTDMAIGVSKIFGIKLSENFDRPYFSTSISEFWKKWHITLSFWLRDYVFLPVAYSFTRKVMKSKLKIKPDVISYIAGISITMLICGIWHGAKWTYIVWGLLHGIFLSIGFLSKKPRKRFYKRINLNKSVQKFFGILTAFSLVSFAWVFFRANSFTDAGKLLTNLFDFGKSVNPVNLFEIKSDFYTAIVSIALLFLMEIIQTKREKCGKDFGIAKIINIPVLIILFLSLFIFGKFEQLDFLYFRF